MLLMGCISISPYFVDTEEDGPDQCQLEKLTQLGTRPMTSVEGRCWPPWPALCVLWSCVWTLPPLLWGHSSRHCCDPPIPFFFSTPTTTRDITPDLWAICEHFLFNPHAQFLDWASSLSPGTMYRVWHSYRTFCMYSKALTVALIL